MCNTSGECSLC